ADATVDQEQRLVWSRSKRLAQYNHGLTNGGAFAGIDLDHMFSVSSFTLPSLQIIIITDA
ncbi:MAG: hypothetical protein J2P36_35575, partial [Ktedonobacteraceae bacterium]|nr:hypothetical protein [Ktedonobacteraceae bacterium]